MPRENKTEIIARLDKKVSELNNRIECNFQRYHENNEKQRKIIGNLEDEIAGYKNFLFQVFDIENIGFDYFNQITKEKKTGRYVTSYKDENNHLKYIVMKNYGSKIQKAEFSDYKHVFMFLLNYEEDNK